MKKSFRSVLCLAVLSCSTLVNGQQEAVIDQADVTRIITTLASDEMEGRMIYTPGIEKASQFIQSEFEKIGLDYLEGLDSYEQQFNMYAMKQESASASLNGTAINAENILSMTNSKTFSMKDASKANVMVVGASDNMQAKFGEARGMEGKTVMLVNTAHSALFNRFKAFFNRPRSTMSLDENTGMVMVLTDVASVDAIDINIVASVEANSLSNVAGMIKGNRPNEIVLFSAHYDHLGIRGNGDDKIFNGANDDASGTTAVMALAKYFKETGTKPERTIMFVAFTAEESGGFGSTYFSQQLNPDEIVAMFNIEMIGTSAKEGTNSAWITGFDKSDFGALLQKAVEGTNYKFYADPYPKQNLFYRSDNATLARLGVPAHSISTTQIDVDPYYHKATDEIGTIDLNHMTNTIRALAKAAVGMISGEDTPTRVDPANVR